jgi:hypothetical protein
MRLLDLLLLVVSVGGFVVGWSWFVRRQRSRLLGGAVDVRAPIEIATHDAVDLGHASAEPVHLIRATTLDPRGQRTLDAGRVDVADLRTACDVLIRELPIPRLPSERDYRSSETKKVSHGWLIRFLRRAAGRGRATIPGLLVQLPFESQIEKVLERHGVTRDAFRDLVVSADAVAPSIEIVNDGTTTSRSSNLSLRRCRSSPEWTTPLGAPSLAPFTSAGASGSRCHPLSTRTASRIPSSPARAPRASTRSEGNRQ